MSPNVKGKLITRKAWRRFSLWLVPLLFPVAATAQWLSLEQQGVPTFTSRAAYSYGDRCVTGYSCLVKTGSQIDELVEVGCDKPEAIITSEVRDRKISGSVDCLTTHCSGDAQHYRYIYADATPNTYVRVNVDYAFVLEGTFGASVEFEGVVKTITGDNGQPFSGTLSAIVKTPANWEFINGRMLYRLGALVISASASGAAGQKSKFSGLVTNVSARYTGKALFYVDGANQPGCVNSDLPAPFAVKVVEEATNIPIPDVEIGFAVTRPDGVASVIGTAVTGYDGVASKTIPLGNLAGQYTVSAICPDNVCVVGGRAVNINTTARGKALVCEECEYYGRSSQVLPNPFRLKVVNNCDGRDVPNAEVEYSVIRHTDNSGNTDTERHGAIVDRLADMPDGLSRARLRLGTEPGVYVVRAYCPDCADGHERFPTGTALSRRVELHAPAETTADPTPNREPCLSGCCPYTPVIRAAAGTTNGTTFTSHDGENEVQLGGLLLPTCLMSQGASISWSVISDPNTPMDSGTPDQPDPGSSSHFYVGSGRFQTPEAGRALPLAYQITASHVYSGRPITSVLKVKQDEIDKCRQEYLDLGVDFLKAPRNSFVLGLDSEFNNTPIDCFAYIRPVRGGEAHGLINKFAQSFGVSITSGYRSPRKNRSLYLNNLDSPAVRTSWHMFGKAVDLDISPRNGENWKNLWLEASHPKIIETGEAIPMMKKWSDGTLTIKPGYTLPSLYDGANCLHLGE